MVCRSNISFAKNTVFALVACVVLSCALCLLPASKAWAGTASSQCTNTFMGQTEQKPDDKPSQGGDKHEPNKPSEGGPLVKTGDNTMVLVYACATTGALALVAACVVIAANKVSNNKKQRPVHKQ